MVEAGGWTTCSLSGLKYECVYLHAFASALRAGLTPWIGYYNGSQPHSGLPGRTPDEAHATGDGETKLAA